MTAEGGLIAVVWLAAVGISIAAFVVIRLNDGEVEQPLGDVPWLHPEMLAAGSDLYRAGGRAEDKADRRDTHNVIAHDRTGL